MQPMISNQVGSKFGGVTPLGLVVAGALIGAIPGQTAVAMARALVVHGGADVGRVGGSVRVACGGGPNLCGLVGSGFGLSGC